MTSRPLILSTSPSLSGCLRASLIAGVQALKQRLGKIDRLFGALEYQQVQIADAREALGIEGISASAARNFRDKARMKDVLRGAGVPCARHKLALSLEGGEEFDRSK